MTMLRIVMLVAAAGLCASSLSAATLSYTEGTFDGGTGRVVGYVDIVAREGTTDIWSMRVYRSVSDGHAYWTPGEIASFKDLQHGGTAFEYSPEAGSATSRGLMSASGMQGTFNDTDGQQAAHYEFTKTATIQTGITATLVVRIHAPTVSGDDFRTIISATHTITNTSGAAFDLWGTGIYAGTGSLAVEDGGLTSWAIVNPTTATAKPNVHETDTTDGHPLYTVYDWYGSTSIGTIPGFYAKAVVKDNEETQSRNMRAGLTFELRCDNMDYYYVDLANSMKGSTTVSTTLGLQCRLSNQPGVFGSGATLADGESVSLAWEGIISTTATQIPPVARAGNDFEVVDADDTGSETVTLDGSESFDPDGEIVSYIWTEGETELATGATAVVSLAVGLHTITLTVTDDDGGTNSEEVVVSVRGARGYTYYVDFDGGSDTADGRSTGTAWKHSPGDSNATDVPAATSLLPGDTVIFKGGVKYRGLVRCTWSGLSEATRIVFDGNTAGTFGTGRAILDGAEALAGWVQCAGPEDCDNNPNWESIYYTYAPAGVTVFSANLYEDDQMLALAQDPDPADPFWIDDLGTYLTFDSANDTTIVDADYFTMADADYWDGPTYVLVWAGANAVYAQAVTGYVPSSHTIEYESLGVSHYNPGKYSMCNSLKILDKAGEYVVRTDETGAEGGPKIYLMPLTAGVEGKEISVSVRSHCMDLASSSYVTVQGFRMQKATGGLGQSGGTGSAVVNAGSGMEAVTIRDNEFTMSRSWERQPVLNLTDVDGCLVEENSLFENSRSRGMILNECTNSSIRGNVLRKNGGTAIDYYRSHYSEVVGNTVLDHLGVHANGITVYLSSSNILVAYNTVRNSNVAFTGQASTNLTLAYNLFETSTGVYTVALWNDCDTVAFYNNVIRNLTTPGSGISAGSSNTNVVAKNNIIDGSSIRYNGGTAEYNIYTSLMWTQNVNSLGTGEVRVTDLAALFVDAAGGDYHLAAGSPAIDFGVDVGETMDLDGSAVPFGDAPDAGAYEYGSAAAESIASWGAGDGETAPVMGEDYIESRSAGLAALRITFASALDAATVSQDVINITGPGGDLSSLVQSVALVGDDALLVTLTGPLPDGQWYTLTVSDDLLLEGGATLSGDQDLRVGVLVGDVDGNGVVSPADILAVRSQAGFALTAETARYDVDGSGQVSGADLLTVRSHLGNSLP